MMSTAKWHGPDLPEFGENYVESPGVCAEDDIAKFRSAPRGVADDIPRVLWDEIENLYPAQLGKVDDATLQRENPIKRGGGGASGRKHTKPVKLDARERMRRREQSMQFTDPQNYLPESDEQKAERHLIESQKRVLAKLKRGRPRKGEDVLKTASYRVAPETAETLRAHGVDVGPMLDHLAAVLKSQGDAA